MKINCKKIICDYNFGRWGWGEGRRAKCVFHPKYFKGKILV
jgi:hypothetical protein